jgi:hypothetical protein
MASRQARPWKRLPAVAEILLPGQSLPRPAAASATALVAAVSILVCAVHIALLSGSPLFRYPVVDARWHYEWASAVARGDILANAPYFRAPLYPWLLGALFAVTGPAVLAGAALSALLVAGSAALFHRIALGWMKEAPALALSLAWACWAPMFFLSGTLLIEPLYILLLLGAFLLLDTGKAGSGLFLLGLSVITRPGSAVLLPVALLRCGLVPGLRRIPLFLLPIAAVWCVNSLSGDPATFVSSQGGINLYLGNGPEADGFTAFAPAWVEPPDGPYEDNVHAASRLIAPAGLSESGVSAWWASRTLRAAAGDVPRWFGLIGRKILLFLSPVEIPGNYDMYYCRRYSLPLRLLLLPPPFCLPAVLILLMLPGAVFAGRLSKREMFLCLWALLLSAGVVLFFVTSRLRLPCVPFILLLVASRFARSPRRGLALAPAGVALAAGLLIATGGAVQTSGVNMPFYDALAHYSDGRVGEARALFLESLDKAFAREDGISLNRAEAMYDLGLLEAREGNLEDAESWFRAALEDNPRFSPAARALELLGR